MEPPNRRNQKIATSNLDIIYLRPLKIIHEYGILVKNRGKVELVVKVQYTHEIIREL